MSKKDSVPSSVIRRLPRYYSYLKVLMDENIEHISSKALSERMKITASQIRQDLNHFGGFGQQGFGYNIKDLHDKIGNILGVNKDYSAILFGYGNLGKAIASQLNFDKKGCKLIGIFDIDKSIIGEKIADISIMDLSELDNFCKEHKPTIAVLCVPKDNAYPLSQRLLNMGIKSFWNFSHFDLNIAYDDIVVENVHLGDSLLRLIYKTKDYYENK